MNIEEAKLILNKILDNYFIRGEHLSTITSERKQAIETILAERKQDKKIIQELEEVNKVYALSGSNIALDIYIKENYIPKQKEKDKQIAKYEKIYKEYDCYRWVKELDKKDKQIDLMAEYWQSGLAICENCINIVENYDKEKCEECIKQYFAGLVEKE